MKAFSTRKALPGDAPAILRLLRRGLRSFSNRKTTPATDRVLPAGPNAVAVDNRSGTIAGFISFEVGQRSASLPAHAPTMAPLQDAALAAAVPEAPSLFRRLLDCAAAQLPARPQGHLLYLLSDRPWLDSCSLEAGFEKYDSIQSFRRTYRSVPPSRQPAAVRPARKEDLPLLAALDAAAFAPLWHMGEKELLALYCDSRLEVAEWEGEVTGYSAMKIFPSDAAPRDRSAHLLRLAVHPATRSCGIGRQLVVASLEYALAAGVHCVVLNTQESNVQARNLYQSLHFRAFGKAVTVYTRHVPGC